MSITKMSTKDGQAKWIVRLWVNGRGSKRIKRSFEKRIDAENFLHEFKSRSHQLEQSHSGIPKFEETTFEKEAEAWLEDGRLRFSASHLVRVQGVLKKFLPKFGHLTPDQFTPSFLSSLQKQMKSDGYENATVNRETEVITAILNFSVKQRRIPYSPASGFRKLPVGQKEMLFWEREEAESFLSRMAQKYPPESSYRWVYVSYLLALNTGLRAGEIWGLQPRDLLEGGEMLFIRRQWNRTTRTFTPTKGKKPRQVACNEELRTELESLIAKMKTGIDQTIFHGDEGKPINHDTFGDKRFDKDVKEWGGRRIRFHDLRHTATTLMIGAGVDLKTVKEICGHKNIMTTMNYAHLLGENLKTVARSFSIKPRDEGARLIQIEQRFPKPSVDWIEHLPSKQKVETPPAKARTTLRIVR